MNAFRKHELCAASTTIAASNDGGAEMCEKRETVSVVMMDALYVCKQRTRQLELLEAERVHQRIGIQKLMQRCCARCFLGCSKFLALLRMQREYTFPPLHSVWLCDVLREVAILEWPNICAMRTGLICTRLFVFVG